MSYYHLTLGERESLLLLNNNEALTQIANAINRSKSCISRKFRRNTGLHGYMKLAFTFGTVTRMNGDVQCCSIM
jgi:IS30 family transposase